jgi:hypothetical protein
MFNKISIPVLFNDIDTDFATLATGANFKSFLIKPFEFERFCCGFLFYSKVGFGFGKNAPDPQTLFHTVRGATSLKVLAGFRKQNYNIKTSQKL